jgi:hypothetical protein
MLALAGLPFFMLALADPYTQLQQQEVTFRAPHCFDDRCVGQHGRALQAARLTGSEKNQATFFTAVAAAETFIRQRIKGGIGI